ncbi:MAG: NADH-quinone oxidoreductase subunit NuoE [Elusimicrobia bacterium CG_4_10_14_0_2_um_filter_56_8]|nr:MAG: NADH-quinone oxidoreductase subunit NuoE [Elusimicrobia bacterium CG_4_10_14_0_2_um_filter_56_8]
MAFILSEEFKARAAKICARYPRADAALIPLLLELQKEAGYVAEEGMDALAQLLELPYSRVKAVTTFYTMFKREPAGKYHLRVCRNISCHMAGAAGLLDGLKKKLAIEEGETTKDGIFTLSSVECLGACGSAPVMQVNEHYFENLNEEKLDALLEELKHGRLPRH